MSQYLDQAIARLNSEAAPDLSDASIEAAIGPCVGGRKFVALVKQMRDVGILTIADLHHLESRHDVGNNVRIPQNVGDSWGNPAIIPPNLRDTPEVAPQVTPEVNAQGTK